MARASSVCSVIGCPEVAAFQGRCRGHAAQHDARQRQTVPTKIAGAGYQERQRRAAVVAEHRRRFGDWCPGWGQPPHEAADLTAQHADALVLGGSRSQDLTVLCRSCNSRHGVRARRAARGSPAR